MSHVPLIRPDTPFYEALPELSPASVKTYLVLARHANRKTGTCWPKVATIVEQSGLKERAVRGAIADLVERGLVISERKKRNNIYTLRPASDCRSQPDQDLHRNAGQDSPRPAHSDARPARSCRSDLHRNAGYRENPPRNPTKEPPNSASLRDAGECAGDQLFDSTSSKPPMRARKRDDLFDAVAEADGVQGGSKIPAAAARRIGAIVSELRAKGATPEQVRERWPRLRHAMPSSTVHALAKNWDALGRPDYGAGPKSVGRAGRDAMTDPREVMI